MENATTVDAVTEKKPRRSMTVYGILFIIIAIVAGLTWVLPAGRYDYHTKDTHQLIKAVNVGNYTGSERLLPVPGTWTHLPSQHQGFFDVLSAPVNGFVQASDIALFVLVIGGFLSVAMESGAMTSGIAALVTRFKGREHYLIPILMVLFGIGGSTYGMCEETVALWALIVPIMVGAGYDRMVAAGVLLLGFGVGVLASTVNPFATGIASGFAGIPLGAGIVLRLVMFAVLLSLAIFFVMRYAAKVKKDPTKSILHDIHFEDELSRQISTPLFTGRMKLTMTIFVMTFVVMIYGVIPWDEMGITFLPTWNWWFTEMTTLFIGSSILIGIINRNSEPQFVKTFIAGASDLCGVALIIAVARGIYVIMQNGMITDTVLHWSEGTICGLSSGVFIVVSYWLHIILSFFIPSTSGLATLSMPLMGPMADFAHVKRDLIVTSYQSGSGLINLFSPSAAQVIAGLAIAKIPYARYLRWVLPYLIATLVITSGLLFVAAQF